MKKLRIIVLSGLLALAAAVPLSIFSAADGYAAPIPLFDGTNNLRLSGGSPGEGRWTFFEALNDVTITQLGVLLDPSGQLDPSPIPETFKWEIHSTNPQGVFDTLIFETTTTYVDVGLQTYDTDVFTQLPAGFYAMGFIALDARQRTIGGNSYRLGVPHVDPTIDGNFRVLSAASSLPGSSTPEPVPGNNTILPRFSVNTLGFETPRGEVPEPTTFSLLAISLAGVGFVAWRRRRAIN